MNSFEICVRSSCAINFIHTILSIKNREWKRAKNMENQTQFRYIEMKFETNDLSLMGRLRLDDTRYGAFFVVCRLKPYNVGLA